MDWRSKYSKESNSTPKLPISQRIYSVNTAQIDELRRTYSSGTIFQNYHGKSHSPHFSKSYEPVDFKQVEKRKTLQNKKGQLVAGSVGISPGADNLRRVV